MKKNPQGDIYSSNPNFNYEFEKEEVKETLPPTQQKLKVLLDKKQRNGKKVTLITGFTGTYEDIKELGRKLKTSCGTGGSVKDNEILLQGDFRDKVVSLLTVQGYKAKKI